MVRENVPEYDERFRGYGMNKISHIYEMSRRGFQFCVIDHNDAFVVADSHPKSESWQLMYGPGAPIEHRARVAAHYIDFKKQLAQTIGAPMTVNARDQDVLNTG